MQRLVPEENSQAGQINCPGLQLEKEPKIPANCLEAAQLPRSISTSAGKMNYYRLLMCMEQGKSLRLGSGGFTRGAWAELVQGGGS